RITARLEQAIQLVQQHGSTAEADALRKFFQVQGYEHIPLHRSFVDASIGRDATTFLSRQIERLEGLTRGRTFLRPIILDLREARDALERTGYLNLDPQAPQPSDRQ